MPCLSRSLLSPPASPSLPPVPPQALAATVGLPAHTGSLVEMDATKKANGAFADAGSDYYDFSRVITPETTMNEEIEEVGG